MKYSAQGTQMTPHGSMTRHDQAHCTVLQLLSYCRANQWAGHDPYDALNSRIFNALPFLNSRIPRLIMTQVMKRSPVDFRPLLVVPKTQNPKAIGLFLSAILKLSSIGIAHQEGLVEGMIDRLVALRSPGVPYWCWGYSFPWQTRSEVVTRGSPNLVCTTFVANALLDAYEQVQDLRCLKMATSAAEYILNELYWSSDDSVQSFAYPLPSMRVQVHNANFLGSALLCRVSNLTGDKKFLERALAVARCSVAKQKPDGSWEYGEGASQHWIDNFHTGFNLGALKAIGRYLQTAEFDQSVLRGFQFYRAHFFRQDGAPKYFHDRTYPIDIHCVAQSIITLTDFQHLDASSLQLANKVLRWAMDNKWDRRGFFYYRVLRLITIRISYMRWSQAWMLLALASMLHTQSSRRIQPVAFTSASVGLQDQCK